MTKEEKVSYELAGNALFSAANTFPDDTDWRAVLEECKKQTIVGVVLSALPDSVPEEVRNDWKKFTQYAAFLNARNYNGHFEMHRLLSENRIPYVILKGIASSAYYPDPLLRTSGDVDFLVEKEKAAAVEELMRANGFELKNRTENEWNFTKGGITFELHLDVTGIPEGEKGSYVRSYLSDLLETAVKAECFRKPVCVPDDFHHGIILLCHTAIHMTKEGIGLRHLCDWACFMDRIGESFPGQFEKPLKKMGLYHFARALTLVCERYLGLRHLSWTGSMDEELLESLMEDMLRGGNFGNHRDDTKESILVASSKADPGSYGNRLKTICANLSHTAKFYWPWLAKVPVLIPFALAFMGIRYEFRVFSGNRPQIEPKKMLDRADVRNRLYEELAFFVETKE